MTCGPEVTKIVTGNKDITDGPWVVAHDLPLQASWNFYIEYVRYRRKRVLANAIQNDSTSPQAHWGIAWSSDVVSATRLRSFFFCC